MSDEMPLPSSGLFEAYLNEYLRSCGQGHPEDGPPPQSPANPLRQVLADWEDDAECVSCGTRAADCCDSMLWGPVMLTCCPACPSFGAHVGGPRFMTVGSE